jgi:hypothetical protein
VKQDTVSVDEDTPYQGFQGVAGAVNPIKVDLPNFYFLSFLLRQFMCTWTARVVLWLLWKDRTAVQQILTADHERISALRPND